MMIAIGRNAPCPCGSGRKFKRCCSTGDAHATGRDAHTVVDDDLVADLAGVERWFGYDETAPAHATPFDLPAQGLVCMAWEVGAADMPHLYADGHHAFTEGSWAVSTGAHESTVVHGPFTNLDAAFAFARAECGAVRFLQAPIFDFDE